MAAEQPAVIAPPVPSGASLYLQLLLILLVVQLFRIEVQQGLFAVMVLASAGFAVHRRLPVAWRAPFFLLVSLASFPVAFWAQAAHLEGWTSEAAFQFAASRTAWVFGLGFILIAATHLPATFGMRAVLLIALAGLLILWRSDQLAWILPATESLLTVWKADGGAAFWPVLGSMFMFRLWIYLRETRRESKPAPWSQRMAYFFLLPNACFPFFPVVDYRRFRDGYRPDDGGEVALRGLSWMLRGIIHLLLYRVVKIYLLPGPFDLIDLEYIALFLVTNYALYLRISGYFHIITGLLHLFGYDLPRTHDSYFLASSLSDIWRRINIYWKDFLTEHIFYPTYFALRSLPRGAAVTAAVLVVFVASWLLHSWQAFWLIGEFPLTARDATLWLTAGVLVAINSLWQYRTARQRGRLANEVTLMSALRISLQTVATFLTVAFFWACWTIPRFPQLIAAVATTGGVTNRGIGVVGGTLLCVIAAGTIAQLLYDRLKRRGFEPRLRLEHSPATCIALLGLLAIAGLPSVQTGFGHEAAQHFAAISREPVTASELGQEVEGYYEQIAAVSLQSDPLLAAKRPADRKEKTMWSEVTRTRDDLIATEMIPGWQGTLGGAPFRVNRWGMRDNDLSRRKPPGTYRIALVGSSATMGYGVSQEADFESLLERRLNEQVPKGIDEIELLNFGTGGYVALQWAAALDEKVFPFAPDTMLYIVHQGELLGSAREMAKCHQVGYPLPYACLDSIIAEAGITEETTWVATELRLQSRQQEILTCLYRGIVADCRRHGVKPVWVYLPMPGVRDVPDGMAKLLMEIAGGAGFAVIDLSDWAAGRTKEELIFDGHHHPNELGHRLIADRLFDAIRDRREILPFHLETSVPGN